MVWIGRKDDCCRCFLFFQLLLLLIQEKGDRVFVLLLAPLRHRRSWFGYYLVVVVRLFGHRRWVYHMRAVALQSRDIQLTGGWILHLPTGRFFKTSPPPLNIGGKKKKTLATN